VNSDKSYIAYFGWSLRAIEAIDRWDRRYVIVAPKWAEQYARENDIPFVRWDFERLNDLSGDLYETLRDEGVDICVPLYEETVEWTGAINARLLDKPRLFHQAMLFRDKAMMKRRAQMLGIRVGCFEVLVAIADVALHVAPGSGLDEEAHRRGNSVYFPDRVIPMLPEVLSNDLCSLRPNEDRLAGDPRDPIHIKPFDKAGCLGHRVIHTHEDVDFIHDDEYPCLMESHLDGKEFACEVFIKNRRIQFLNISEYVHLGYSVFIPAG